MLTKSKKRGLNLKLKTFTEEQMKHLTRIMIVFVFVCFVFGTGFGLNAEDQTAGQQKKMEECKGMKCPVCKQAVDKEKTTFKSEYKDGIYYFCCEKCKAAFDKDMEKYAAGCHYKYAYVCPMKECNVTSDKAGKCPKCGMELKKIEAPACCKKDAAGCCAKAKDAAGCSMHMKTDKPK
jgi:YHS domain-containing protein